MFLVLVGGFTSEFTISLASHIQDGRREAVDMVKGPSSDGGEMQRTRRKDDSSKSDANYMSEVKQTNKQNQHRVK